MADPTVKWSATKIEKLIELWESCALLWDVTSKEYKDKKKKIAALQEIATKLETTVEDITKKMKSLRYQYNREKAKLTVAVTSGKGTDDLPSINWVFYRQLHFLKKTTGRKPSRSNLVATQSQNESQNDVNESMELMDDRSVEEHSFYIDNLLPEPHSTDKPPNSKRISKKRRLEENKCALLKRAKRVIEQATMSKIFEAEKTKSANVIFGEYVASESALISDYGVKQFLKNKIQNVIFECTMQMPPLPPNAPAMSVSQIPSACGSATSLVQTSPKPYGLDVVRAQNRQEIFASPSSFQGGPSPFAQPTP